MRPIKKDRHYKRKGGVAVILDISCAECDNPILAYQKDGHGSLYRCYLNRILSPESLASIQDNGIAKTQDFSPLHCSNCDNYIGTPMLHNNERFAFRLVPGSYRKTKRKENI